MKIVITESQYNALIRRFSLSKIESEFEYRLKKDNPCKYESFDDFFNWVAWRTEDTIHYKIRENEKLNLDLEQERNFRKMIQDFIYNNFSDVTKKYYNYYKRIHCPNK